MERACSFQLLRITWVILIEFNSLSSEIFFDSLVVGYSGEVGAVEM